MCVIIDSIDYSADAGRQFHSSVGRINSLMKRVGHSLNLKAHKHPIDAAEIYGPCDIEVRLSHDTSSLPPTRLRLPLF
jgi:hypothetical protein